MSDEQTKLIERLEMEIAFLERGHASLTEEREYFRKQWQMERNSVVKYLRSGAFVLEFRKDENLGRRMSDIAAEAIERGEHLRAEKL